MSTALKGTIDLLSRLVAQPTVSNRPLTELAAMLARRAEDAGMTVERFETEPGKVNVVASVGPRGTDGLVLSGHMDVVPVAGQGWRTDPFQLTEADGRLYGRGTCDMKGFLAAVTDALPALPLSKLSRELVLIWTHDEEVGCLGSAALGDQLSGRTLPSLAWIGEPTSLQICRLHPGHLTVDITCTGRPAHSSRPTLGLNAIEIAAEIAGAMKILAADLAKQRSDLPGLLTPWTVMNTGCIHGGSAINIVPEQCVLQVGFRPLPGLSAEVLVERIRNHLAPIDAAARQRGGRVDIVKSQDTPGLLTPSGTTLEALLRPDAATEVVGGVPFATDGGNLARLGTRSLVFGPGSIDVAHRPDEFVPISALHTTRSAISRVVMARCMVQ
ncbi:MAG: acetylornithine deacetylase [Myxococcota bacterium]|nr:acetylornithine deacetylase [Myxococcota bacterium]